MAASTPLGAPRPDFTSTHSVVLDHPLSKVFPVLATSEGHERVTRISALCTEVVLLQLDTISIPRSTPLSKARVRTLPSSTPPATEESKQVDVRNLPRQFFRMQETVPVLFGLFKKNVPLTGTLTWDEDAKVALYESCTDMGIVVWKLREFEEMEGEEGAKKTVIRETIEGNCPAWMAWIVQREATKAHREHMERYHTLF